MKWILKEYNTEKYGSPSWKLLLKAVSRVDETLFDKLAKEHKLEGKYKIYQCSTFHHRIEIECGSKIVKRGACKCCNHAATCTVHYLKHILIIIVDVSDQFTSVNGLIFNTNINQKCTMILNFAGIVPPEKRIRLDSSSKSYEGILHNIIHTIILFENLFLHVCKLLTIPTYCDCVWENPT